MERLREFKQTIIRAGITGSIWGSIVFCINLIFRGDRLELPFLLNFTTFLLTGVIIGILMGVLLKTITTFFSCPATLTSGVLLSIFIWSLFFSGGLLGHYLLPSRYHINIVEIAWGIASFISLGILTAFVQRRVS